MSSQTYFCQKCKEWWWGNKCGECTNMKKHKTNCNCSFPNDVHNNVCGMCLLPLPECKIKIELPHLEKKEYLYYDTEHNTIWELLALTSNQIILCSDNIEEAKFTLKPGTNVREYFKTHFLALEL